MTTTTHAPTACDAEVRLKRASFAFQNMLGDGRLDLGQLKQLLAPTECDDHKHVPTASRPLDLDPHESYYRPPYAGRD
jgi:hypothetical protein